MPEPEEPGVTPDNNVEDLEPIEPPAEDDPDKGAKNALVAEREARRKERDERKQLRDELATLKQQIASKDKPAEEQALETARHEGARVERERANARIVSAELRAAAAGRVKNPSLIVRLIDVSDIEVSDDGDVNADDVKGAIDNLLTDYPELAVDGKIRGSADQGTRGEKPKPKPPTFNDIIRAARTTP